MTSPQEQRVGALLQNRRRQKGLSVEEAAHDLRINPRFLRALEEEKWEEFPARVYLQGFLKRYAASLGLDGDELVAFYRKQTGQAETKTVLSPHASPPEVVETDQGLNAKLVLLALGVIALLVVGVYVLEEQGEKTAPPHAPAVQTPAERLPAGRAVDEAAREFEVRYRDEAWSRVFVDGQVIFEGLSSAGATRLWKGINRFKLVSPRLASVEVRVDGKKLEFSTATAKNEVNWSYEEDHWRRAPPPNAETEPSPKHTAPAIP